MSDTTVGNGHCLCGKVKVKAANMSEKVWACHCGMCRRWTGGPFLAVECGTEVAFEGEDNIGVYDSSDWAERGFCKTCGTHLFYRVKQNQQYFMPVGLFDNGAGFVLDHQIFIDKKPGYYTFADKTQNMTEAEVFAKYAPPE